MRSKIKLLLVRAPGVTDAQIGERLDVEVARLQAALPGRLSFASALAIGDADFYAVAAGAFDALRPFDAILDIVLSEEAVATEAMPALERLVVGMAGRLADLVQLPECCILAGEEHVILPGEGPVMVLIANRRLAHFSHDGFLRYWLDYHGPFAREHTPPEIGFRYRQFHADEALTARFGFATGFLAGTFDGAAECFYPDQDSVRRLMGMTQVVDQATVDEKEFVDHVRCVTSVLALR